MYSICSFIKILTKHLRTPLDKVNWNFLEDDLQLTFKWPRKTVATCLNSFYHVFCHNKNAVFSSNFSLQVSSLTYTLEISSWNHGRAVLQSFILYIGDGSTVFCTCEKSRFCLMGEKNMDWQHNVWVVLPDFQGRCGLGLLEVVHQEQNNRFLICRPQKTGRQAQNFKAWTKRKQQIFVSPFLSPLIWLMAASTSDSMCEPMGLKRSVTWWSSLLSENWQTRAHSWFINSSISCWWAFRVGPLTVMLYFSAGTGNRIVSIFKKFQGTMATSPKREQDHWYCSE